MKALSLLLSLALLSGCQALDDYNRAYFAEGDLTAQAGRIGGRISRADKPGTGTASLEWAITGSTRDGKTLRR